MTNHSEVNLYQLFRDRFCAALSRDFLRLSNGQAYSFGLIDRLSAQCAGYLKQLGLHAGDRVLVQVDKSPMAVVLYLACLRLGLIYVPLNTAYTAKELGYFINDTQAKLLVCRPQSVPSLKPIIEAIPQMLLISLSHEPSKSQPNDLHQLIAANDAYDKITPCMIDDIAAMLYTSGTTGQPKAAMLSIKNLISNARSLSDYWEWETSDVLLHALPIFHIHGLFVALHIALLNASPVLFLERFEIEQIRSRLKQATVMMGVPTFYTRLLADDSFSATDCHHIRLFISGSAPLNEQTFLSFEERTRHRIVERYGMTETSIISSNPIQAERIAGTVGFALPDIKIRITDEDGQPLPTNQVGMIEVNGPNVFQGYWRKPEKTAEEFRPDGFFVTGDLGSIDQQGRIRIVGRSKDLIISGGYNIYPKEIEICIDQIAGVKESAVIGIPDDDYGEIAVAVVVSEQIDEIDESLILDTLKTHLARFKHPRKILFNQDLPRNAMGKVQKNILRQMYANTKT